MWDLEALRYLNEQAHLKAVELANSGRLSYSQVVVETKVVKPSPVFPLSILAKKLIGGPPSLAYFVELLELGDTFIDFRDMVREYLPGHEVNIMAEELDGQAAMFCRLFGESYFPLADDFDELHFTIADLLSGIPTQPLGFSYESYHSFVDFRAGYILALSLVECPWDGDPFGEDEDDDEGIAGGRIPILEMVSEMVGEGLVRLMPDNGWSAEDLRRMTDGTEFQGLGDFADWVFGNTGCYHLDAYGESRDTGQRFDWGRDEVDFLTDDWKETCEIMENIHRVALLLEQDSVVTFTKLLALLLNKHDMVIAKEQLPLPLD